MAELKKVGPRNDGSYENGGFRSDSVNSLQNAGDKGSKDKSASVIPLTHVDVDEKPYKRRIYKNLVVVSIAFLFNFTAFQSLSNLQSSLNFDEGLGVAGLSVIYGGLVLSCLFLPPVIIKRFGCKWTVAFSFIPYILYTVANFYAHWGTIIPTSFLLGLGAAPLWSAKCTYLTETGLTFAEMSGETTDAVINRFFGIFFMIFQSGQIWGNLISAFVLQSTPENGTSVSEEDLSHCGASFCGESSSTDNSSTLQKPDDVKVYTLCGIYVACGCVAVCLVIVFLDNLERRADAATQQEKHGKDGKNFIFSMDLLIATVKHIRKHFNQVLLIPLTIYSGLEQAFIYGDYTLSFVSCTLGIWNVGFVMICFGVTNALCSLAFGRIVKFTGRIPIFLFATLVHFSMQITLLLWQPKPDVMPVFFVVSGLWGVGDAVWQTQINALYGCIFSTESEAAFANYRLWESLGFIVAFAYSSFLCVSVKLYILIVVLVVGMLGYLVVEYRERKKPV